MNTTHDTKALQNHRLSFCFQRYRLVPHDGLQNTIVQSDVHLHNRRILRSSIRPAESCVHRCPSRTEASTPKVEECPPGKDKVCGFSSLGAADSRRSFCLCPDALPRRMLSMVGILQLPRKYKVHCAGDPGNAGCLSAAEGG